MARKEMRHYGWGSATHQGALSPTMLELLRERVGIADTPLKAKKLADVNLPSAQVVDIPNLDIRTDHDSRVLRAAGKGYPDLVRMRAGTLDTAPDAVVVAHSENDVETVLRSGVAVVPFGGGTSVVGGVEALRGNHSAVVALDLGELNRLTMLDEDSHIARFEPGIQLPDAEAALNQRGFTLGHFPQSYEYATVGGCVATRSAGQASTGYGRMEELVVGLKAVSPQGNIDLLTAPATAAGPDLRQVLIGSEGVIGVLTSIDLRVRPLPPSRRYEGVMFPSFAKGVEAFRALEHEGVAPDIARLSDESETEISFVMADSKKLSSKLIKRYLHLRGVAGGCLVIVGWEGTDERVNARRVATMETLSRYGAVQLGQKPGRAWVKGRFHGPYLRDDLLEHGVMVETLETATTWSNLTALYSAVKGALHEHAPIVMCHISHIYETGASLYYTFLARQQGGQEIEQWKAAKTAACRAIVKAGGTITHHHAIGQDHAPYLQPEVSDTGISMLKAIKSELDPNNVMNPGKLLT